jgi:hypothetical protein
LLFSGVGGGRRGEGRGNQGENLHGKLGPMKKC